MSITSKRAVGYLRVSHSDQVDNESIETPTQIYSGMANRHNILIVKWFIDEGVSAKTADRKELRNSRICNQQAQQH
jgi:DNA invertase Pin-like site-specific DNA recombinase